MWNLTKTCCLEVLRSLLVYQLKKIDLDVKKSVKKCSFFPESRMGCAQGYLGWADTFIQAKSEHNVCIFSWDIGISCGFFLIFLWFISWKLIWSHFAACIVSLVCLVSNSRSEDMHWEKCGENFVHLPKNRIFVLKMGFFTQIC